MIYESEEIKKLVKAKKLPQITEENYYDNEINKAYMSFHTWASFHGTLGLVACEARALAELNGDFEEDKVSDAFLLGGYVDAALVGGEGELDTFKEKHPEMFVSRGDRKGELQAKYAVAEKMIARCRQDELFMQFIDGEHQAILVCMICGVPFKCKIDSLVHKKALVDLKTTREMHKQFYIPGFGHADFISYYGYVFQLALYREMVKQIFNETQQCFVAAVSKSEYPEIKVIHIDEMALFDAWTEIQNSLEHGSIVDVWRGEVQPIRCENPECHYCMATEVLKDPINYKDLIMSWGNAS